MTTNIVTKTVSFFLGLFLMSLGSVVMIKVSSIGVQPWDVLHISLNTWIPIFSIGFWSIIIGAILVLIALKMTKQKLQMGTVLDTLFVGVFMDAIIYLDFISTPISLVGKITFLLIGTILIALGAAIVIVSDLGAGPRDTFMLALHSKFGISIKKGTTILEFSALIIGSLLGGPWGTGSFVFAFLVGPCIELFLKWIRKLLSSSLNTKIHWYINKSRKIQQQ